MSIRLAGVAALAIVASTSAAAAQSSAVRSAHAAIVDNDLTRAERLLTAEQRVFPHHPEVLINLAAVYARTGRVQQASALYRQVLAREDVLLDLSADRTATSHVIAETGLRRVGGAQTAAR